jgi:ElaB/YqjD/DUF883 family membrane-anchored ribosome-binding protein
MAKKVQAAKSEPTRPVDVDDVPELKAAEDAVRQAREELEKACSAYKNVRQEAAKQVRKLRESTVGDVIDESLKMVRRHPAIGVGLAALIGFFLGRLFRR